MLPHLCFVRLLSRTLDGMMVNELSNHPLSSSKSVKCCSSVAAGHPAHPQPFPNTPKHAELSQNTVEESVYVALSLSTPINHDNYRTGVKCAATEDTSFHGEIYRFFRYWRKRWYLILSSWKVIEIQLLRCLNINIFRNNTAPVLILRGSFVITSQQQT